MTWWWWRLLTGWVKKLFYLFFAPTGALCSKVLNFFKQNVRLKICKPDKRDIFSVFHFFWLKWKWKLSKCKAKGSRTSVVLWSPRHQHHTTQLWTAFLGRWQFRDHHVVYNHVNCDSIICNWRLVPEIQVCWHVRLLSLAHLGGQGGLGLWGYWGPRSPTQNRIPQSPNRNIKKLFPALCIDRQFFAMEVNREQK